MTKKITLFVGAIFLIVLVAVGYYFFFLPRQSPSTSVAIATDSLFGWKFPASATKFPSTGSASGGDLAYSSLPDPGGVPSGLPITLQIPAIGVNSAIEDALITPDGRMDVPAGTVDVAWFALGPQPGQVGSAVIGGHYGIENGVPFVFYNLDKLKIGDDIYIINDENNTVEFAVKSIASFNRNSDATTVFTSTDGLAHLNLITCEGVWNEVDGNYPDRLVVFTDLVSSNATIPATIPATNNSAPSASTVSPSPVAFSSSLGIGATGQEVVELQTFLEQRGLLSLPSGVVNGYFGTLTSAAVSAYQETVGISPVGIFGPLTIAKINSDMTNNPVLPNTGESFITPSSAESPVSPPYTFGQVVVLSVASAYSNIFYGLVTSVLLILIIFMVFKIIL